LYQDPLERFQQQVNCLCLVLLAALVQQVEDYQQKGLRELLQQQ
jgi:hypothetical protein